MLSCISLIGSSNFSKHVSTPHAQGMTKTGMGKKRKKWWQPAAYKYYRHKKTRIAGNTRKTTSDYTWQMSGENRQTMDTRLEWFSYSTTNSLAVGFRISTNPDINLMGLLFDIVCMFITIYKFWYLVVNIVRMWSTLIRIVKRSWTMCCVFQSCLVWNL